MTAETGPEVPHVDARDADERAADLREDIEQTREQLAGTVAGLAHKADVKARVRNKAASAATSTATAVRERPLLPLSAVAGAILAVFGYLAWWRRR
jgi:ElaB/YqjD/DUF883 family membrane-anchored ribosome-binding protein